MSQCTFLIANLTDDLVFDALDTFAWSAEKFQSTRGARHQLEIKTGGKVQNLLGASHQCVCVGGLSEGSGGLSEGSRGLSEGSERALEVPQRALEASQRALEAPERALEASQRALRALSGGK